MKEEEIKVTDGETVENEQDKNVTDTVDNEQGDVDINENTDTAEQENDADEADSANMSEEKSPLEVANEEIAALKDKYLRTVAEFENYKKRTLKEKAELILNGGEKTVTAILPVLDDFERALADKTEDAVAIKEGMELIFKKFVKSLESLGVKKIETEDKTFDVDFHEAIAMVPGVGDDKKGKVIDCVQTGYTLNDKVIRHAKVAVGQ
ncbi:MAG: nucleotide exchange factor GrpE [Prevotella sp.]|nr:nucleotide exchange factor GrpE [Prevotella sp.]